MLEIAPLTATIGAEIAGVDLADHLDDAVIEEIREALLEWKVVFFRDQHRLDRTSQVAFGRRFGELEIHPITPDGPGASRGLRHPGGRQVPSAGQLAL